MREVGAALGASEDAAKMRLNRAVEKLRQFFDKRGVIVPGAVLTAAISANAVQAAPVGLVVTISSTAAVAGTALATATTITKAFAMTTLQKSSISIALAAAIGVGIYEARQISTLRTEVKALRQQQLPLVDQIQQLTHERDGAQRQLISLLDDNERLKRNTTEIQKLRGDAARLRQSEQELAKLRANGKSSADLRDLLSMVTDDPEWKDLMRKEALKETKRQYSQLFNEWKLSPDEQDEIAGVLADRQLSEVGKVTEFLKGGDKSSVQNEITSDQARFDSELKTLLGDDRFSQFKVFENTAFDRRSVSEFSSRLQKQAPLSEQQSKQLLDLLIAERANYPLLSTKAAETPNAAQIEQLVQAQGKMDQQVRSRAAAFLTAEQIEALKTFQADNRAGMKNFLRMQEKLWSGDVK